LLRGQVNNEVECMSEGVSEGVRLTVEVYPDDQRNEWFWEVAERLDEDPAERPGPGTNLGGDRWIASGAVLTLDGALSAINTAITAEIRNCFA
jgi:hypothetical protein